MKQVGYASEIVPLLEKSSSDENKQAEVTELLKAQLSHSDGIRGFFVIYLTGTSSTSSNSSGIQEKEDNDQIPKSLLDAMNTVESDELVSLACESTKSLIYIVCSIGL